MHDSITDCRPKLLMTLSIKRQGPRVLAYRGSHSCNCPDGNSSRGSSSFFELYIYIYLCLILIAKRGFRRIFRIGVESYDFNINRNL